ncbi:MAG: flagellar biosynthesis anti-sigma factor FlgM [Dehalococcoidia bacterium]|nr:flagellar biosynthesis anti-sigma factor FlgM [Dehalococcoidia bacterium]
MAVRKTSGTGATGGVVYDLARGRTAVTAAEPQVRTDSAGITPEARELSSALHAVETSDEVRAEKVRALREQIANGTYAPDPREIAKKLVERGF